MRCISNPFVVNIVFKFGANSRNRKSVKNNHEIKHNLSKSMSNYVNRHKLLLEYELLLYGIILYQYM